MAIRAVDEAKKKSDLWDDVIGLGIIALFLAIFGASWVRTGCLPQKNLPPLCGPVATLVLSVAVGLLISMALATLGYLGLRFKPYDPTWLVELARLECPEDERLAQALTRCTRAARFHSSPKLTYFVSPSRPNRKGSSWQYRESVIFETHPQGGVELVLLQDGRVGSVECLWILPGRIPNPAKGI